MANRWSRRRLRATSHGSARYSNRPNSRLRQCRSRSLPGPQSKPEAVGKFAADWLALSDACRESNLDRDRGTPRGAAPPTPPGIRVTYLGGSTRLSFNSQCRCEAGRENRIRGCVVPFEPRDVLTFAKTPSVSPRRPQQGTLQHLYGAAP